MRLVVDPSSHFSPQAIGVGLARLWQVEGTEVVPAVDACGAAPVCPITLRPIEEPVLVGDGSVYEQAAIVKWLLRSDRDPCTNLALKYPRVLKLEPLRDALEHFLRAGRGRGGLGAAALRRAAREAEEPAKATLRPRLSRLEAQLLDTRRQVAEAASAIADAELLVNRLRSELDRQEAEAAPRLQAAARGMLARRAAAELRQAARREQRRRRLLDRWPALASELLRRRRRVAARLQMIADARGLHACDAAASQLGGAWRRAAARRRTLTRARRVSRVVRLFRALDLLRRGRLQEEELRLFADLCGFQGDATAWSAEYRAMADIYGWDRSAGADPEQFLAMVDDRRGCAFCTCQELGDVLEELAVLAGGPHSCRGLRPGLGSGLWPSSPQAPSSTSEAATQVPETSSEREEVEEEDASGAGQAEEAAEGDMEDGEEGREVGLLDEEEEDEEEQEGDEEEVEHDTSEDLQVAPPVGTVVEVLYDDDLWYRALITASNGVHASVITERDEEEDDVDFRMHSVRLACDGRGGGDDEEGDSDFGSTVSEGEGESSEEDAIDYNGQAQEALLAIRSRPRSSPRGMLPTHEPEEAASDFDEAAEWF